MTNSLFQMRLSLLPRARIIILFWLLSSSYHVAYSQFDLLKANPSRQDIAIEELKGWQESQGLGNAFDFGNIEFLGGKLIAHVHPKCECESFAYKWRGLSSAFKSYHKFSFEKYLIQHISFTLGISDEDLIIEVSPNKAFSKSADDCNGDYSLRIFREGPRISIEEHIPRPLGERTFVVNEGLIQRACVGKNQYYSFTDLTKINNLLLESLMKHFKDSAPSAVVRDFPKDIPDHEFSKEFTIDISHAKSLIVTHKELWEHVNLIIELSAIPNGLKIHFKLLAETCEGKNYSTYLSDFENMETIGYGIEVQHYEDKISLLIKSILEKP